MKRFAISRPVSIGCFVLYALLLFNTGPAFCQSDFWERTNGPYVSRSHQVYTLYIDSEDHIWACARDWLYRSTNNGEYWKRLYFPYLVRMELLINSQGHIFVGAKDGIYRSTDTCENWAKVLDLEYNYYGSVFSLKMNSEGHILAGTRNGVYRSMDNGENWAQMNSGLPDSCIVRFLTINPQGCIFAAIGEYGVFRSTDNGHTWSNIGLTNKLVFSIAISSSGDVFAGTRGHGIWRLPKNQGTWENLGLTEGHLVINSEGHLFAAVSHLGIYRSTDNGQTWDFVYEPRDPSAQNALFDLVINSKGHIFAGGD